MASNIRFTKLNMTAVDGYFFMFDEVLDVLFEITSDGTTAFSYPLDTALSKSIISLEHDGVNFWSMERGTDITTDVIIKRWKLENYICKLKQTVNYIGTGTHKYDSNAFTVEHYHTTVTGAVPAGSYTVGMQTGFHEKLLSGMTVTLGPNEDGYSETIAVAGSADGEVVLQDQTEYAYLDTDKLQFYTDIWMFNNYDGVASTGALYDFNAYSGSYKTSYPGAVYSNINSATFYEVDSFSIEHGIVNSLMYVKASNILFVDVNPVSNRLVYYGSMAMDNIAAGGASVYTIHDLAVEDQNIYRLQVIDSGNNYSLSTLDSIVASVALEASPAILPANEISSTTITAVVKDQFFQPVAGRLVTFQEDEDSTGYLGTPNPVNTNAEGVATIYFRAGNKAAEVTITAIVDQS